MQYSSGVTCGSRRYLKKKKTAEEDKFIKKKWRNRYGWLKDRKKGSSVSPFSICEQVLLYADSDNALYIAKENPERISYRSSRHDKNEVINA